MFLFFYIPFHGSIITKDFHAIKKRSTAWALRFEITLYIVRSCSDDG